MAYDEALAQRVRDVLRGFGRGEGEEISEIKMFGGLCFTINRKMLVGTGKNRLMIRLTDGDLEQALASGSVDLMDFTGKPMRNFAYIKEEAYASDAALLDWIEKSAVFVRGQMKSTAKRPKKA